MSVCTWDGEQLCELPLPLLQQWGLCLDGPVVVAHEGLDQLDTVRPIGKPHTEIHMAD